MLKFLLSTYLKSLRKLKREKHVRLYSAFKATKLLIQVYKTVKSQYCKTIFAIDVG